MKLILPGFLLVFLTLECASQETKSNRLESPLPDPVKSAMNASFDAALAKANQVVTDNPGDTGGYSKRGDAYFFLGRFPEAVSDYDKMIELDQSQKSSHWRRGIALFYAERYEDAAAQFDSYHSFDQVDRENGIWRYLSQCRASGRENARIGLLKYKKDDREPFPSVYKLFAGTMEAQEILDQIAKSELSKSDRELRLFYAQLYIGLNYAVEKDDVKAQKHLAEAVRNTWGQSAGYGPHYMWQVGRLHEELLRKKLSN